MTSTAAKKAPAKKRATVPAAEKTTAKTSTAVDALTDVPAGVHEVDLSLIDPHPHNPRKDVGDLTDLIASVEAQGIRQNLLLVPHPDEPGRYRTVIGHRRAAAARELGLGTVPAAIDPTLDPADQRALMLVENIQRTDLTPFEEADGVQGLLDLGWSPDQIAGKIGRSETTVRTRARLAPLDPRVRPAHAENRMTLDDAFALADIRDRDEEIYKGLCDRLDNGQMPGWAIPEARKQLAAKDKVAALLETAKAEGVKLVKKAPGYGTPTLKDLGLKKKDHADCPGARAFVGLESDYSGTKAKRIDFCDDPKKHHGYDAKNGNDEWARRRQLAQEFETAAESAAESRRAWVRVAFADKGATGKQVREAARTLVARNVDYAFRVYGHMGVFGTIWAESGTDTEHMDDPLPGAPLEDRTVLLLLSRSEHEVPTGYYRLEYFQDGMPHARRDASLVTAYLAMLTSVGYVLSDNEQQVLAAIAKGYPDLDNEAGDES